MSQETAFLFLHSFYNSRGYSLKINLLTGGLVLYFLFKNSHLCLHVTKILIVTRRISSLSVLEYCKKKPKTPNKKNIKALVRHNL